MILARREIARDWRDADEYLPSIRKVTADDIRRVAALYLVPDNRTVGILVALPPGEGKAPAGPLPREQSVR